MKKLLIFLTILIPYLLIGQTTQLAPYKATQVVYTNGKPNDTLFNPETKGIKSYSELDYDFTNKKLYTWNRTTNKWEIANASVLSDSLSTTFNSIIDSVNSIVDSSLLNSNSLNLVDSASVSTGKFLNGKEIFVFYNAIPGSTTVGNNGGWGRTFGYLPNTARVIRIETEGDIFAMGSTVQINNGYIGARLGEYMPSVSIINSGISSRSIYWNYAVTAGAVITNFAVRVYYYIP